MFLGLPLLNRQSSQVVFAKVFVYQFPAAPFVLPPHQVLLQQLVPPPQLRSERPEFCALSFKLDSEPLDFPVFLLDELLMLGFDDLHVFDVLDLFQADFVVGVSHFGPVGLYHLV